MVAGSCSDQTSPSSHWRACCPVLAGPTAVGKTALVVHLASRYPVEVISLDSRQVYHGLRIGTAQPTTAEQAACRHHLIDFLSPRQTYAAARYRRDFIRVYREIVARNRVPVLVGGAGLYLQCLQKGLFVLPGVTAADTARLREELQELTDDEIRSRLRDTDRPSWERIHPNDRYRSQRALEISILARRPLSEIKREQESQPALGLEFPVVLLQRSAADTATRILHRTHEMLASGWVTETESLLAEHGPDAAGLATLGYREICAYLLGRVGREEMEERIVVTTRQYAKRQRTWFRQVPTVAAGLPEDPEVTRALDALVARARKAREDGTAQLA